jgi:hypothetical protein
MENNHDFRNLSLLIEFLMNVVWWKKLIQGPKTERPGIFIV